MSVHIGGRALASSLAVLAPHRRREHWVLGALLLVAAAVRFAIFPAPGNVSDIAGLSMFAAQVAAHGPHTLYDDPTRYGEQYVIPPLFPMTLGALFRLWGALASGPQLDGGEGYAAVPPYPVAALYVKLLGLAGDLAVGTLVALWVRQRAGVWWMLVSAALFLFNPAFLYDTAWWGQIESLLVLCIGGGLVALARGRVSLCWALLTAGLLLKPQVVVALPVAAWLTLGAYGRRGVVHAAVSGTAVALLVTAPYWATGRAGQIVSTYAGAAGFYPQVSVNALNAWRAAAGPPGGLEWARDTDRAFPALTAGHPLRALTYQHVGLLAFGAYYALVLWRLGAHTLLRRAPAAVRDRDVWLLGAAGAYLAFFLLPTQIHERYLYPGLALLTLVLHRHPLLWLLYAVLTLGFFANLAHVVPSSPIVVPTLDALGLTRWRVAVLITVAAGSVTALLFREYYLTPAPAGAWRGRIRPALPAATLALGATAVLVQAVPYTVFRLTPLDALVLFLGVLAALLCVWPAPRGPNCSTATAARNRDSVTAAPRQSGA